MAELNWEMVVAFLGTLVVIMSYLYKMNSNTNVKKEDFSELERKIQAAEQKNTILEGKVKDIEQRVKDTNQKIEASETFMENEHKKVESKLEKLTDLIIDFIQHDRR